MLERQVRAAVRQILRCRLQQDIFSDRLIAQRGEQQVGEPGPGEGIVDYGQMRPGVCFVMEPGRAQRAIARTPNSSPRSDQIASGKTSSSKGRGSSSSNTALPRPAGREHDRGRWHRRPVRMDWWRIPAMSTGQGSLPRLLVRRFRWRREIGPDAASSRPRASDPGGPGGDGKAAWIRST